MRRDGIRSTNRKLGVIIPTLQKRQEYLEIAIMSALRADPEEILIISPLPPLPGKIAEFATQVKWIISDSDLPTSINEAVSELSANITHFTWLGDDDMLIPKALQQLFSRADPGPLMVAPCQYIEALGNPIRIQQSSKWRLRRLAMSLISSPIAQPSTLISVNAFNAVGGINGSYKLAFDQDLFTKLIIKFGPPAVSMIPTAYYRVHPETLSSKYWQRQLKESAQIRLAHSPKSVRSLVIAIDKLRFWANWLLRKAPRK